jgi:hypothetical protein
MILEDNQITNVKLWKQEILIVTLYQEHIIANELTSRKRVLLKIVRGPQLVKKFPVFYRTPRLITAFGRATTIYSIS